MACCFLTPSKSLFRIILLLWRKRFSFSRYWTFQPYYYWHITYPFLLFLFSIYHCLIYNLFCPLECKLRDCKCEGRDICLLFYPKHLDNICWMKSKRPSSSASAPSPVMAKLIGNQGAPTFPIYPSPRLKQSSCMDHHDFHVTPPPTVPVTITLRLLTIPVSPLIHTPADYLYQKCGLRQISYLRTPDFPALYPRIPLALASPKPILNQSFPQPSPQLVLFPSRCLMVSIWSAITYQRWNDSYTLACFTYCLFIEPQSLLESIQSWKIHHSSNPLDSPAP